MKHIDERILALRHKNTSPIGTKVKEKSEQFFEGLIEMVLPDIFLDMKEEMIQKVFLQTYLLLMSKLPAMGN